jgi:hypothetical protein
MFNLGIQELMMIFRILMVGFYTRRLEKVYSRNCHDAVILIFKDLYHMRKMTV